MLSLKPSSALIVSILVITGTPQLIHAQSNNDSPFANEAYVKRIKREVQPIPYWVDSSSLNLRNNPVAGKIVGKLDFGQKVMAYSQYENWIRVSKPGAKEQWVNSDFLSNSRLSWAGYNRNLATRSSDIVAVRIKDPENRKKRIYGVRLKTAETGNALITTREDTANGPHFQNRFVSCENQAVIGVRLIGEGNSFLSAQNDIRNSNYDIYESETINRSPSDSTENAISKFACKVQSF